MNAYEILFIIKTNYTEQQREKIVEKIEKFITAKDGKILNSKDLGLKDFAMELKKETQGYYFQIQFNASNEQLTHLQDELKITEDIFRYMIVTLDSVLTKEALTKITQ